MAGNFTPGVSKKQPGAYFNFESEARTVPSLSERGIVIMPLMAAKYGPLKEFILVEDTDLDGQYDKFGFKVLANPELLGIRETIKRANKVYVYIPATGGVKALATEAPLTVTAKHVGTRGNDFQFVISNSVTTGKLVEIFLGTDKVFEQDEVVNAEDLNENDFVDFTGTGALVDTAGTSLLTGADALYSNVEYTDMLNEMEVIEFNTAAFPTSDATLKTAINTKFKYFFDTIGKKVIAVTADNQANHEAIISINNGVTLTDGTVITKELATHWVAGASAAASIAESITDYIYDDSIDATPRLTSAETDTAIDNGEFVFYASEGFAKCKYDINSLKVLTGGKDKSYKKNRVIRVLGEIATTGSKEILRPNIYDNNPDGQALVKLDFTNFLLRLQQLNALKNVDVDNDFDIDTNLSIGDELYSDVHVQPVDSIEKFYITVKTS